MEIDLVLEEAANAYISNENNYSHSRTDTFKAGARWQKKQMMSSSKSGTVQEDCQIILDDGAYIDLDPSMSLNPSFPVKAGERVKVIIIQDTQEYIEGPKGSYITTTK